MADTPKVGKCKALQRSGRQKVHNAAIRPQKVHRARERHLKNATRSCGKIFADKLRKYYATIPTAPKKVERRRR